MINYGVIYINKKCMRQKPSWKKTFALLKDYFVHSDEKVIAWLLLIGSILSVAAIVALTVIIAWWSAGFWAVLTAKALIPFLISIGELGLMSCGFGIMNVLRNYLSGKLALLWRNWLTQKFVKKLFDSDNNYLEIKRCHSEQIDNIEQRIQEDIKNFVELSLSLGLDFFQSTLSIGLFIGTLWIVGGALSLAFIGLNIVIPGYLVWIALLVALLSSVATHFIGKSLKKTNQKAECTEAELRQDLSQLSTDAENIAEEHAEAYYKKSIQDKVDVIKKTAMEKNNTQTKLFSFQSFYEQISQILPYICAAPIYFTGLIGLDQLMEIGIAFGQVSKSLGWFINAYEEISKYQASVERLIELEEILDEEKAQTNPKSIQRKIRNKETLKVKNLDIMQAKSSSGYMIQHLTLELKPGEHTLIQGPSGLGKSTLFKVIANSWKYGQGKVSIPEGKRLYFLPQTPTLPNDTLHAVLAYPESSHHYTEEACIEALQKVGGMNHFITKLHEKRDWSKELSPGQKQRLSFARALLKKPDWLFLDETTASLDEDSEKHIYSLFTSQPNMTIVSIAHRRTVEQFHARVLKLQVTEEDREASVEEVKFSGQSHELIAL